MKVVVFGSREFEDFISLKKTIESTKAFQEGRITHVISGAARGADMLAARWAKSMHIPVIYMPANWDKYGKAAGFKRNEEMAELADAAIGFWNGKSLGTKHMIDLCKKHNVPLFVCNVK